MTRHNTTQKPTEYRFSFGPWNIHEGADPFGPEVREIFPHADKFPLYKKLGFDGVQFHDDDVVPDIDNLDAQAIEKTCAEMRKILDGEGLEAEFVAPRLWFNPQTVDGAYTANDAGDRQYGLDRTLRCVDIARAIGSKAIVLWLAREGSYIRESKNARIAYQRILDLINRVLAHDSEIEIWVEPKPNEPTDQAYVPTAGHAVSLAYASNDPHRVRVLIETAHVILTGLDPADEMAFALSHDKLASVHLNDQNGLKYDQDKSFGSVNLRAAFNQVRVLEEAGFGSRGEFVGLDVKTMRTQKGVPVTAHLDNSRHIFLRLVEKARSFDQSAAAQCIAARDYEALDRMVLEHLLG